MVKSPLEQRDDDNVKADLFLKEAGLESSPMDPASMEALKEFLLEMPNVNDPSTVNVDRNENRKPPPLSRVEQATLQRRVSDLTQAFGSSSSLQDHDTAASTAGSTAAAASPIEQKILDQLHQQTELIWQLHRRVETLTATVEQLSGNNSTSGEAREAAPTANTPRVRRREVAGQRNERAVRPVPRAPAQDAYDEDIHPDRQAVPQQPENPPARGGRGGMLERIHIPVLSHVYNSLAAIPDAVRNSRAAKILRVYVALRQREAPNFDAGLILKVLVMVTIFMSRMSNHRKNPDSFLLMYRTYLLGVFIIAGFLIKTGYLKFMHAFIVKANYPGRIWDGEEIDIDNLPPLVVARPRGPVPARNAGPLAFLQRTLLGGRIPRMDPARRGALVLNVIQDFVCLVGSFFLSIFPMWAPEAPPAPRQIPAAPQQQQQPLAQQQQEQHQDQQQDQQQQLPGVQPPADAFEAEVDDNAD
jgi:hypothetical protein